MGVKVAHLIHSFILGGLIVGFIKYLSKYFGSQYAAVIWAFPLSIIPTIMIMYIEGETDEEIIAQTKDYAFFYPTLILYLALMSYFIPFYQKHKLGVIYAIITTFIIWLILCVVIYNFILNLGEIDKKHISSVIK